MADLTIKFKGQPIAELSESGTKTLKTAGKYCEDDINVEYAKPAGGGGSTVELDTTLTQSGKAADAKAVGDALAEKQPKGDYLTQSKLSENITLGRHTDGLVYIFIGGNPVGNGLSISGVTMDEITVVDGTMTILALAKTPTQNGTTLMIS